jgi:hypothetical protein
MISVVLYGRNDNYGYNLHKRAALSFNCMAEVLTDPTDEILFVDYNTPDDSPTFPEAIHDTLTQRARNLLRIFRVRPRIHDRFKAKTHLKALEPVARNVAVRRSNPQSRWILSTNTDMIFVPLRGDSLTDLARGLPAGFYHAPRMEIPEALWENLDRMTPLETIRTVRDWGNTLHLNEVVLGAKTIRYDAPGDFQLLLRTDLFENSGFDEAMLLGWHVDSNIAKRMYLKYGAVGDLGGQVYGYHCDHTRQVTPMHSHTRVQNDWRRFIDNVDRADLPEQVQNWGCAEDIIEEIRPNSESVGIYLKALRNAIAASPVKAENVDTAAANNEHTHDPQLVMPFLVDMFASTPSSTNVAWFGAGTDLLGMFARIWEQLNFTGKILVEQPIEGALDAMAAVQGLPTSGMLSEADTFIFDVADLPINNHSATPQQKSAHELLRNFFRVVRTERARLSSGLPPRRLIALGAVYVCESRLGRFVATTAGPYPTLMRHGFVLPSKSMPVT